VPGLSPTLPFDGYSQLAPYNLSHFWGAVQVTRRTQGRFLQWCPLDGQPQVRQIAKATSESARTAASRRMSHCSMWCSSAICLTITLKSQPFSLSRISCGLDFVQWCRIREKNLINFDQILLSIGSDNLTRLPGPCAKQGHGQRTRSSC